MGTLFLLVSSEKYKRTYLRCLMRVQWEELQGSSLLLFVPLQDQFTNRLFSTNILWTASKIDQPPFREGTVGRDDGGWGDEGTLSLNIGCAPSYSPISNQPFCYFVIFMIHLQNDTYHSCSKLFTLKYFLYEIRGHSVKLSEGCDLLKITFGQIAFYTF